MRVVATYLLGTKILVLQALTKALFEPFSLAEPSFSHFRQSFLLTLGKEKE